MKIMIGALAALAAGAGAASAHVVINPDRATAGGYYAGELRVSHGCAGSPTVALRVEIPPEALSAKPQPKPGWRIAIERAPLATPRTGEGGAVVRDRVTAITWSGLLADDAFDTFGLMLRLPAGSGAMLLPVVQRCRVGEARWVEPPSTDGRRPDHPAPRLLIEAPQDAVHAHVH